MANTDFLIGHGGYCYFTPYVLETASLQPKQSNEDGSSGFYIPLLDGSYSKSMAVPIKSTFSTPYDTTEKLKFRTGTGSCSFSGSMNMELSTEMRDVVFNADHSFFYRNSVFDVELCDGEYKLNLKQCVWSSLSLNVNARALPTLQIQFQCCNNYENDIAITNAPKFQQEATYVSDSEQASDDEGVQALDYPMLEPYWTYGAEGVTNFTLSFNRAVQPVYLNMVSDISQATTYYIGPTYLRVGLMDVQLNISCWQKWFDHKSLRLGNKIIIFDKSVFNSSKEYSLSGIDGNSTKSYTLSATGFIIADQFMEVVDEGVPV